MDRNFIQEMKLTEKKRKKESERKRVYVCV